ncbi:TIGR04282 family arsenosugar biosynthesis glycosyltransferase [Aurantibacter sp.]|uniref:TIGR04282 family arsenosugar biosynthesis glycosyltransferase n=1 Tax=Aurantibacter sp. TaxID=2807103 RepID=UPI0032651A55
MLVQKQQKTDKKTVHFSLINSKNLLLIFTRNPELGKCKTRLAAKIGNESALEIYKFLLKHTVSFTQNLNVAKHVYYSEEIWEDDIWDSLYYDKKLQTGDNLGDRMANAFQDGFTSGFEKIIVIGSDMYDLSQSDIESAFSTLDNNDFVLGPADDGGYYLLGMKNFNSNLFQNKDWGTATVLENSLKDLADEKLALLDTRNDIDVYEDIENIEVFYPFIKHMKV